MILLLLGLARAGESPPEAIPAAPTPSGEVRELEHPRYVDQAGNVWSWDDVRTWATHTDAPRVVRSRRNGRAALRVGFAVATAAEVWGTYELARDESLVALPLGVQAGFTGLCEALLWARIPEDRRRDRAIVLDRANGWLRTAPAASQQPQ